MKPLDSGTGSASRARDRSDRADESFSPITTFPFVDAALQPFAPALGADGPGYRNHIARALNFFIALRGGNAELPPALQAAVPFHDLAIWTHDTFDYLEPSAELARAHLQSQGLEHLWPEVQALVVEHHKLRPYRGPHAENVELYRRADLVDLSLGLVRFGLTRRTVQRVRAAFPDAGFHRRLLALTLREALRHPLRPLPMLHR